MSNPPYKHGPWTVQATNSVYRDPWIAVTRDEVIRPDGQPGSYSTVQLKSGVCVVALDENDQVHLTKEFHYAVGRDTLEGVSGGMEENETPKTAARRELQEELGLTAATWEHLGRIDPFTAAIHSTVDLFLATQLTAGTPSPEGSELIEHVVLDRQKAIEMVFDGRISHSPSCVLLLRLALQFDR